MARWVSASIAAEILRTPVAEVLQRVKQGELEMKAEGGFEFINLDTTYCLITPDEQAALAEDPIKLSDIRTAVATLRRRPMAA